MHAYLMRVVECGWRHYAFRLVVSLRENVCFSMQHVQNCVVFLKHLFKKITQITILFPNAFFGLKIRPSTSERVFLERLRKNVSFSRKLQNAFSGGIFLRNFLFLESSIPFTLRQIPKTILTMIYRSQLHLQNLRKRKNTPDLGTSKIYYGARHEMGGINQMNTEVWTNL